MRKKLREMFEVQDEAFECLQRRMRVLEQRLDGERFFRGIKIVVDEDMPEDCFVLESPDGTRETFNLKELREKK